MPDETPVAEPELVAGQPVPYDRFSAINKRMQAAESRLAELAGVEAQATAAQAQATAAEQRFSRYQEAAHRGLTDTSVYSALEAEWDRLPKSDRPSLGAWIDSARADPSIVSPLLRPHLAPTPAPAAPGALPAPAPVPATKATPAPPASSAAPGAGSGVSQEAIRAAREEGVRTGNWTKWKEIRKSMGMPELPSR